MTLIINETEIPNKNTLLEEIQEIDKYANMPKLPERDSYSSSDESHNENADCSIEALNLLDDLSRSILGDMSRNKLRKLCKARKLKVKRN